MINDIRQKQFKITALFLLTTLLAACGGSDSGGGGGGKKHASSIQSVGGGVLGQIGSGNSHFCAVTYSGEVRCWGYGGSGGYGVLGNNASRNSNHPVTVVAKEGSTEPLKDIVQVGGGYAHTCALTSGGEVRCWGWGEDGELGNGDDANTKHPVTVVAAEDSTEPLKDIVQITSGNSHNCALTSSGQVRCWGNGANGRLGNDDDEVKEYPVAVVAADASAKPLTGIVQIAAGERQTCALTSKGRVWCWGGGSLGVLGDGDDSRAGKDYPVPVVAGQDSAELLKDIVQIAAGVTHVCALTSDGEVLCWGSNTYGELGNDSTTSTNYPVRVVASGGSSEALGNIVQISAGGDVNEGSHTCALTSVGEALCWGDNHYGQLGSSGNASDHPVKVVDGDGSTDPLQNIVQISVGGRGTCALTTAGSVLCWGYNNNGELGDDSNTDRDYPVGVVEADGSDRLLRLGVKTLPWSCYPDGTCRLLSPTLNYQNSGGGVWGQIGSGDGHTCVLDSEGKVWCWGRAGSGQLGNNKRNHTDHPVRVVDADGSTDPLEDIVAISVGGYHSCALTSSAEVRCWGKGSEGRLGNGDTVDKNFPVTVVDVGGGTDPLEDIVQVSVGGEHTCALTGAGQVVCWGQGKDGRLGNDGIVSSSHPVWVVEAEDSTDPLTGIVQISSGDRHTCALTLEGGVVCWGEDAFGQLGNNNNTKDRDYPVTVIDRDESTEPLKGIVQISSGGLHTCALTSGREVWCWGQGNNGKLGDGKNASTTFPVKVVAVGGGSAPLSDIVQVDSGDAHTCALNFEGTVACWGSGDVGQLGNDATSSSKYPVTVLGADNIVEIGVGYANTCGLSSSGRVVCWGLGSFGRLGNDDTVTKDTAVTVVNSDGNSEPLRTGIHRQPWICYQDGVCQDGTPVEYYVNDGGGVLEQVSGGGNHACAVTSGGQVRCWGSGGNGQLGNDGTVEKDHGVTVVDANDSTTALKNIVQVGSGENHSCALNTAGAVVCWGLGSSGQLGNDGIANTDHPVGVVVDNGDSTDLLENIVQIAIGANHGCALTAMRRVYCWGKGTNGQLGNDDVLNQDVAVAVVESEGFDTLLEGIIQIAAGGDHTCALTSQGNILCWGKNDQGQMGLGNSDVADKEAPVKVVDVADSTTPLSGIIQISVGSEHTCALTSGGNVWCWGEGSEGRLGNDGVADSSHPVAVVSADSSTTPLGDIVQISSGGEHTCALTSGGQVRCWGQGLNGRLGHDYFRSEDHPVTVVDGNSSTTALKNIVQVNSGGDFTCALTSGGKVKCWGTGANGRLGNDESTNKDYPVNVVNGDGSTTALSLGTKKRPWFCYRDGTCQFLLPTDSY